MGQGVYTVDLDDSGRGARRRLGQGRGRCTRRPTTSSTPIPIFGIQATGNSNSIRAFWKPLREAGAGARAMLVQAAASAWRSIRRAARRRTARSSTRQRPQLGYGELVDCGAQLTPPKDPPLKDPKDFALIGKPLKRLDTPDKVNGKAVYGIDAHAAGHEVRHARAAARCSAARSAGRRQRRRRKSRACARSSCSTIWSPWSATTCGPPRRASTRSNRLERRAERRRSPERYLGRLRAASEKDGAVAKSVGDIAKGARRGRQVEATSSCRSSRTRRWSRSTAPCTSRRMPARSGSARRS